MNKLDKSQMFSDNERLIYFIMKKHFPYIYSNYQEREEYYQIGAVALLKAIDNYNPNIAAFSTYASSIIWGEMKRNIRNNNPIHYTRTIIDTANKLIQSYYEVVRDENFEDWIKNELSNSELSSQDKLGIMNYIFKPINLDKSIDEDNETLTLLDIMTSSSCVSSDVEYNNYIDNIYDELSERDKKIFKMHLNDYTQQDMANATNLSQAEISRILKKIKHLTIRELQLAGNYKVADNLLNRLHRTEYDIHNAQIKYNILNTIIKTERENDDIVQKINTISYSKKCRQRLILKCVMKLILQNEKLIPGKQFKMLVQKMLIDNEYNDNSIIRHLHDMTNSQMMSCINLASKNIEKYNYTYIDEVVINESDFITIKIKTSQDNITKPNVELNNDYKSNDNFIHRLISILERFKRDNQATKF